MHTQPNPQALHQALLTLLLEEDGPALWSLTELDRTLTASSRAKAPAIDHSIEDAVEDLYAAGLVHRVGQFVFATRAAHVAEQLAG